MSSRSHAHAAPVTLSLFSSKLGESQASTCRSRLEFSQTPALLSSFSFLKKLYGVLSQPVLCILLYPTRVWRVQSRERELRKERSQPRWTLGLFLLCLFQVFIIPPSAEQPTLPARQPPNSGRATESPKEETTVH